MWGMMCFIASWLTQSLPPLCLSWFVSLEHNKLIPSWLLSEALWYLISAWLLRYHSGQFRCHFPSEAVPDWLCCVTVWFYSYFTHCFLQCEAHKSREIVSAVTHLLSLREKRNLMMLIDGKGSQRKWRVAIYRVWLWVFLTLLLLANVFCNKEVLFLLWEITEY